MEFKINIKKGLGDITFEMPIEEVVKVLGNADEVETMENAIDETTTLLHYNEYEMTLFFEGDNPKLECIDIADDSCILFEKEVFDMNEKEVVEMMVKNNYFEQDVDNETWGERRVTFLDGNIDFYFEDDELISISFGK